MTNDSNAAIPGRQYGKVSEWGEGRTAGTLETYGSWVPCLIYVGRFLEKRKTVETG